MCTSRRRARARPHDPPRHRDAPPRRLRVGPPGARQAHRRPDLLRGAGGREDLLRIERGRDLPPRSRPGWRRDPDGKGDPEVPGDAGPHARVHLDRGVRRRVRGRAGGGAHRRHALHRGRRPAGLGRRERPARTSSRASSTTPCIGKLLTLPDAVRVYPAHGAGSLCGRNISSETSSTIGQQRLHNYALRPMSREEFVALVTADLPEAPAYFSRDARLNREGPGSLEALPAPPPLAPEDVAALVRAGAIVLDTRSAAEYGAAHLPDAIQIGLSGQLASWAGALLSPTGSADPRRGGRGARRRDPHAPRPRRPRKRRGLSLRGGILAWEGAGLPLARTEQIDVTELRERLPEDRGLQLLDVRRPGEWQAGHIAQASASMPLHRLARGSPRPRPRASRRGDLRGRLPLVDRDERPRAAGLPKDHERRRRHGRVDRGEVRSRRLRGER